MMNPPTQPTIAPKARESSDLFHSTSRPISENRAVDATRMVAFHIFHTASNKLPWMTNLTSVLECCNKYAGRCAIPPSLPEAVDTSDPVGYARSWGPGAQCGEERDRGGMD